MCVAKTSSDRSVPVGFALCLSKSLLQKASVDIQQLGVSGLGSEKPHLRCAVLKHDLVVGHAVAVDDVID